ncbi:helix-turn-helix domain-containing protein [Metabacillus sp. YM-086]|uniref:helix-turn-helix domain-containing protein n=1 Tax=Metabacillus sp. YM-086 TaxID=3341729 RepID=UPI003A839DD7
MILEIGHKIRTLRTKRGMSLSELAQKLDVSVGYLSNLETGKSETIQLSFLEKLQKELTLFTPQALEFLELDSDFEHRLVHACNTLRELNTINPEQSEYLLSIVEKGAELFTSDN